MVLDNLPEPLAKRLREVTGNYNPAMAYGDLYNSFFKYIERNIEDIYDKQRDALAIQQRSSLPLPRVNELQGQIDDLDDFIVSLYHNDNKILEETFKNIKAIVLAKTPSSANIKDDISAHIKDKGKRINQYSLSPAQKNSIYSRLKAIVSPNFKPQHSTSLATIRHYRANAKGPIEYRIGTQGQRHHGIERVSPLFERFLKIQASTFAEGQITHIYFNNLGRDRTDLEGLKEKGLTAALEELESRHKNVAVITFPADKGLMSQNAYHKMKSVYALHEVKKEFLLIALEEPAIARQIKDFHISPNMRAKIFQDTSGNYSPQIEKEQLSHLIDQSINALGFRKHEQLSAAQRQAVWFHFLKFELTNHIIDRLQPKSINFSCKDAIDRGGVSSAYYNLIKSFATAHHPETIPLSRDEFEMALHAAPTMVKARGMNHHVNVIWNAVDAYVNAHYKQLLQDPQKAWLIEWRDFNCPHSRVDQLLKERIQQVKHELEHAVDRPVSPKQKMRIQHGLMVMADVEKLNGLGVSGKRLLLETVLRTAAITLQPKAQSKETIVRHHVLVEQLTINHPKLTIVAGLLKQLIGKLITLFKHGRRHELIDSGVATMQAGKMVEDRQKLQIKMKEHLSLLKDDNELPEPRQEPQEPKPIKL